MMHFNIIDNFYTSVLAKTLTFEPSGLEFQAEPHSNVFGRLNNKTLSETVAQPRYKSLSAAVRDRYPDSLNDRIGAFLLRLKEQGDPFYLRFLNPYGVLSRCSELS